MKKLSLRINQTNRLVSQQFYFLETRKFSYLLLSRGANFSSFKITKLHVLLYEISWTKVYLWLTFALSVCLQELWWSRFGRVAVFSWRRAGGSDPTLYQLTRWKGTKNGSPCERLIPGHEIWPKFGKRLTGYGICSKYNAEFGKRFTGYGISLLPTKRDSPTLSARCMIGKKVIFAIPIYSLSVYASTL